MNDRGKAKAMNESHLRFLSSPEWAQMLETDLWPWVLSVGDLGDEVLEVGPGPGLTTDLLCQHVRAVTAVEVDSDLAGALQERLAGTNATVICADASESGLPTDRFSAVTCFSMLHHIPSPEAQDRLFQEIHRVLRPGGILVGVDALDIAPIREGHVDDTFVPVDPTTLGARFEAAGLIEPTLERDDYQIRFVARKGA
ncbi:MAG: class I SAM-dependent methyltransferase [Acidimicrobiales bacterium]